MLYAEIQIAGKLDPQWSDWFEGLEIQSQATGGTTLSGYLPDQPAVFGVITRLASLGMTLESVTVHNQENDAQLDQTHVERMR